jgi:hypothetical protein
MLFRPLDRESTVELQAQSEVTANDQPPVEEGSSAGLVAVQDRGERVDVGADDRRRRSDLTAPDVGPAAVQDERPLSGVAEIEEHRGLPHSEHRLKTGGKALPEHRVEVVGARG